MRNEYRKHLTGVDPKHDHTGIQLEWDGESNIVNAVVLGPEGSPYEGGYFKVKVTLPYDFPFK